MLAHMFMYADDNILFTHRDVLEPNIVIYNWTIYYIY